MNGVEHEQRPIQARIRCQRESLVRRLQHRLDWPMTWLGFAWLVLAVLDLAGRSPPWTDKLSDGIWVVFILDFAAKLLLAPRKIAFMRHNWLTAASLLLPALRVLRLARAFRAVRAARAVRGLRLLRLLTSLNRGLRSLGGTLGRRGLPYVLLATALVLAAGSAGMYFFESGVNPAFATLGASVWWTAMVLVTMGSEAWPRTTEGRLLCLALAVYGFSVFGYVTAALASVFVAQDKASGSAP